MSIEEAKCLWDENVISNEYSDLFIDMIEVNELLNLKSFEDGFDSLMAFLGYTL